METGKVTQMVSTGRPKTYTKRQNISLILEEKDLELLDALRRDTPRGHYIARMLRPSEEYLKKNMELEAVADNYLKIIENDHVITLGLEQRIQDLEAQVDERDEKISRLTLQMSKNMGSDATPEGPADKSSARTAKSEKVFVATSAGEIDSFRKQFLDLNYPILYGFMKNTISQDNLVALQRQLMFTSLPKLKTYLMEEFRRRVNEGIMSATSEPPKPIAPPLTPEQQAYREELGAKVTLLKAEFKKLKAESEAAFASGDQETYNRVKPLENRLDTQLKEAMEAMLAAKENNFIRPPSSPPTSVAPPTTAAVTGQTINPSSAEEKALVAQETPIVVTAPDPAKTVIPATPPATPEIASTQHTIAVSVEESSSFTGMAASDILAAMGQSSPPKEEDTKGKQSGAGK
ncbi:MAG: hypothetical protein WA130_03900 [Candidatus Methanoperedens sp.]